MTSYLFVRDLMTVGVTTCSADTPIKTVAQLLLDRDLEGVVVLDEAGHAIGVVTQDELVRAYARQDHKHTTAESIMRVAVPEIPPDIPLMTAALLMQDMGIRVFFLMHNAEGISYPAAAISYKHFLRHLAASDDSQLQDLGYRAARENPVETFKQKAARSRASVSHQE